MFTYGFGISENEYAYRTCGVAPGCGFKINGHHCLVRGKEHLSGAPVEGTDVRAGASLVLAGLVADDVTYVTEVHHVDRGYSNFVGNLTGLGANVTRVEM